jgi:hypothetical protein
MSMDQEIRNVDMTIFFSYVEWLINVESGGYVRIGEIMLLFYNV